MERGGTQRPPPEWRGMGLPLGVALKTFPTGREVTDHCASKGQTTGNGWGPGRYVSACYDGTDVAIIDPKQVPKAYWDEKFEHEAAHPWGLYHPNLGRDWKERPGSIADNMRKSREGALRLLANPPVVQPAAKAADLARVLGTK